MTGHPPPHGTTARYVWEAAPCRCDECREACRRYHARRRLLASRGVRAMVDAGPVQRHVERLREAGWSCARIATAAGLGSSTVSDIGGKGRVRRETARRLLAVTSAPTMPRVDACGARRRLQALVSLGWTNAALGARIGQDGPHVTALLNGDRPRISADLADRVRRVYDELWCQAPPEGPSAVRARNRAARRGWLPPMALDDDRLDDPSYVPDVAALAPQRRTRADEVADLVDLGLDSVEIAGRLHLGRASRVASFIRTRPDVLARLAETDRRRELGRWTA